MFALSKIKRRLPLLIVDKILFVVQVKEFKNNVEEIEVKLFPWTPLCGNFSKSNGDLV